MLWMLGLFLLIFFNVSVGDSSSLFDDLGVVREINKEISDELPLIYNYSVLGGYFNTPSARMAKSGMTAVGGGTVPPYNIYGINLQPFDHIELSANYRVFKGVKLDNFSEKGFGDDAERIGNIKIAALLPEDGFADFPAIVVGADDFFGTKRFNAQYIVGTKSWTRYNFEASLGWGRKRMKGLFGGVAWTPFRQTRFSVLRDLSLLAEYDPYDYKKHLFEHPEGRIVKSRINWGAAWVGWKTIQLTVNSVRGEKVAAAASLRYPIGTTKGFFPKIDDPMLYRAPVDLEALGVWRPEKQFAQQLAFSFGEQGLDLYDVWLFYDKGGKKGLWLKVINNRYRQDSSVREHVERLLSSLLPSDIESATVVIEADAIPCQQYYYRAKNLDAFRLKKIGLLEAETLAPMEEATQPPEEGLKLFERRKSIWTFTIKPRLLSYFGSAEGKFKYNLSMLVTPEGYIHDTLYYRFQGSYSIHSSAQRLSAVDQLNPSRLINVRTDTVRYYQTNTVSLEQAFLQKSWNLGKGCFWRLAGGYFEPAYGGGATEFLFYPTRSDWAIGAEAAVVKKRHYHGLKFTDHIRKLEGSKPDFVYFLGLQYFLNVYYYFRPLNIEVKVNAGQFLAKDMGIRTEIGRYFHSGLKFSLWYTVTNGHDKVNGQNYYDKGFVFSIPLDIFLKQSSRNYFGYASSAWLRDVGAQSETGKKLYTTLSEERLVY